MYIDDEKMPESISTTNIVLAIVLHLVVFGALWAMGQFSLRKKEVVIPIDLTVVVQENLDGKEDEPPPLTPPKPQPPPPPEPPKQKTTPPPPQPKQPEPEAVEQIRVKTNIVKKVERKEDKKPEKKKPEKKEPPKKTAAELRAERIKAMREQAVDVKTKPTKQTTPPPQQQRNGKTGRKTLSDKEIADLLAAGYRPGATEQIAPNEESRCLGLLKMAIDEKWRQLSPQIGRAGVAVIKIQLDRSGRIASSSLSKSCGDSTSDAAALKVVRSVGVVRGLSTDFLQKYSKEPIVIHYKIQNFR